MRDRAEQRRVEAGEKVRIELYRSKNEIENTVVIIGSHDLILDIIADMMPEKAQQYVRIQYSCGKHGRIDGSQERRSSYGSHTSLDEETGQYNIPYVKRLFSEPMAIIKGVNRIQGIMVKKEILSGYTL